MELLHIISWKYDTSLASFHRDWSLARGIAENGVEVEIDFIMPHNCKNYKKEPKGVHCKYLYGDNAHRGKLLTYICSLFKIISIVKKHKIIISSIRTEILLLIFLFSNIKNTYIEIDEFQPFILKSYKLLGKIKLYINNFINN